MNFISFFKSKKFQVITWVVAGFIILLMVFHAGMMVGYRKASFSYRWGENYHRNFGGPRQGFMNNFFEKDFIESHGTFGQIMKIDGDMLVVRGRANEEKIILMTKDTVIHAGKDNAAPSDLKVDSYIITIGQPNDQGQIEAKFIRIMPSSLTPKQ